MKPASAYLSLLRDAVKQRAQPQDVDATAHSFDTNTRTKKIEGINYKAAAIEYPQKLDEDSKYYLRTKPFVNVSNKTLRHNGRGLDVETRRFFCDFVNIATALGLRTNQRILDVGCGPGWLSEFLARFGYNVTGIDICPEMIAIARERLQSVPYMVDPATPLSHRFLTHDIETAPLKETFDAIICYDSLHHFADERAVLRHIAGMLDYGGLLFILEGDKPLEGSTGEQQLINEMQQFHVLESPFNADYLRALLRDQGFVIIGDYISVNGLYERDTLANNQIQIEPPSVNYLLCKKVASPDNSINVPVPDSRAPGILRARFSLVEEWPKQIAASAIIKASLKIENTGDTVWLTGPASRIGAVTLGVKVFDEQDNLVREFHNEPSLDYALAPGESATLALNYSAPSAPGLYKFKIDLVDQHICWFEQQNSQPLELFIRVQ